MNTSTVKKTYHPLLQKYLNELASHPLRTKALTTGFLCFLQEVLGNHFAGVPIRKPPYNAPFTTQLLARSHVNVKSAKMALYGFLVSAPMSHYLIGLLQRAFAGKTSKGARLAQILASNLLVAPIQTSAYLASMAIINGKDISKTIKEGFFTVIRVQWVASPLSLIFAQNFIPIELWVPFFNAVQFALGTFFNTRVKKAALKKAKDKDRK
ncbi:hypothetical protein JOM56_006371 [Amanita muscaria]|uniref:Peroxisomal membrane protein PMP22 n=1 Tax=Amanita muscaria (strain Koide BX008) TaxID=946122 RepID=A0A0C2T733_AMAMK|nr:hypothetical protein M378DRAFT_183142 [Amanita muscaria Koide BX008]